MHSCMRVSWWLVSNASVGEFVTWRRIVIVQSTMRFVFEILDLADHRGAVVTSIVPMLGRWSTSSHWQS